MAFGKTAEQKQAQAQQREAAGLAYAQRRAADAQQRAAAASAASPVGRATAARDAGAGFFQLELDISALDGSPSMFGSSQNQVRSTGGRPDLLSQIEALGWRLEHVGYVFIETGATTTNRMMTTGQGTVTKGVVRGIYLFRAGPRAAL
jgi:hypothetical protein